MLKKIYLQLLILCGILYHEIIATLSKEDPRESSDLLVRKKRVVSHLPNGLITLLIGEANYMVKIKTSNFLHCAGAILTRYTFITAAPCVNLSLSNYEVNSGSGDDRFSKHHAIISKLTHYGNLPHEAFDGIALITVDPPFVYGRKTGNIQLYTGYLPAGKPVTVNGWGCSYPINPIRNIRKSLRTITLPIMNHEECQAVYRGLFNVTEKHLCTYDVNQHCARNDTGAPLIVDNKLAGIHIWKGETRTQINPDVYLNIQRTDYSEWIREHIMLQGN